MNIVELVTVALKTEGFDGLYVPGACGCVIGDLSPANCLTEECRAGYKHTHSESGDWMVSAKKDGVTDDDIDACIAECG